VSRRSVLIALLVGAFARLALIAASPAEGMVGADLDVYHRVANLLVTSPHQWTRGGEFGWRAPGAFVYLAAFYWPWGGAAPYAVGQVATGLLFVPTCLLAGALVRALGLGDRAALAAIWIRAVLPLFVVADVMVLSEPLFACLVLGAGLAAVRLVERPTWRWAAATGALLAGLPLTREPGLLVAAPIAVVALVAVARRGGPRSAAGPVGVALLAAGLTLTPWLARNQVARGAPLPISSTTGFSLHLGNQPSADGGWMALTAPGHVPPDTVEWATVEWDRWHRDRALEWMGEHPARAAALAPARLSRTLFPRASRYEVLDLGVFPGLGDRGGWLLIIASGLSGGLLVLLLPAALGAVEARTWGPMALWAAGLHLAAVAITVGSPRYLDPVLHLALPGIAALLADPRGWSRRVAGRRRLTVELATAVVVVLVGLAGLHKLG